MKKPSVLFLVLTMMALSACLPASPTASPAATLPPTSVPTTAVPPTPEPSATPTAAPTETAEPTEVPPAGLPDISTMAYLDDLSTPGAVVLSFYNALNRFEYLRAYSYYANSADAGTLEDFTSRYDGSQNFSVVLGPVAGEGAAGSIYYTLPAVVNETTQAGAQNRSSACFILRMPQPGNYGAPPITPMHFFQVTFQPASASAADEDLLASACPDTGNPPSSDEPAGVESLADLSNNNYIDNRSDPVTVVSSLLNAVNRKEYVRAYSYWQEPSQAYADFEAGYAHTESVTAEFGTATPDAGAGQIFYSLPAVLQSVLDDGTRQFFSVCYTLHLSQPGFQGTLPFQPLGIRSAAVEQVDNSADPAALLMTVCQ